MKLTKQGVRDLNTLPGKSKGRRLDDVPKEAKTCRHPSDSRRIMHNGDSYCESCGAIFDWDGLPY